MRLCFFWSKQKKLWRTIHHCLISRKECSTKRISWNCFKICFVRFRTKRTVHLMHTASFISINCIILIADFNLATNIMQFMLIKLAVCITCTVLFVLNLTKHILKQFHEILLVEHSFLEIKQWGIILHYFFCLFQKKHNLTFFTKNLKKLQKTRPRVMRFYLYNAFCKQ